MITRNRVYGKKEPSRDAHKIYIVCEGVGTEPNYFSFFEGMSSNLQLITVPHGSGTDPLKLKEQAELKLLSEDREYTVDYLQRDTVWFVIDTDTWEKEGKITPLREFCAAENGKMADGWNEVKPYKAWNVAQSNPCFEIWLYYHFYSEKPADEDLEGCSSFKEFVNNSISGGFNYEVDQVRLKDAIDNSENNYLNDSNGKPALFTTEVYRLGEEIYGFVKDDLAKLRNKLG